MQEKGKTSFTKAGLLHLDYSNLRRFKQKKPIPQWGVDFGGIRRRFVCIFALVGQKLRKPPVFELVAATCHRQVAIRLFESPASQAKKPIPQWGIGFFGDPPEIRTPDPLLKRQLLCQLS